MEQDEKNEERYQEQKAHNVAERVRQDEVTINLMSMVQMLNNNINLTRQELLAALATHERVEMEEIQRLHDDIEDLQEWKWRFAGTLGALVLLGLVQLNNVLDLVNIHGG